MQLMQPLKQAAIRMARANCHPSRHQACSEKVEADGHSSDGLAGKEDEQELLMAGLLELYANPDDNAGMICIFLGL